MLECRNDEEIMIVVGDSYDLKIYFNNIDFSLIEDLFFTCSKLNISKKFYAQSIDDDNFYILSFNPMETEEFTPCVTDYDLTIKLTSGYTETISYRSKLKISPKTNPIVNKTGLLQIKSLDWDGVILVKTYSTENKYIKQLETNLEYDIAIDVGVEENGIYKPKNYTYEETNNEIKEDEDILTE